MSRSVWKGPFVEEHLLKKVQKISKDVLSSGSRPGPIKTWSRKSTIIPIFVGMTFSVHNGRKFIPVSISEDMVGRKLGEFAPTRTFHGHTAGDRKTKK